MENGDLRSGLKIRWGSNLIGLLVSLLIALVVWGVVKLSASYHYTFHYNVEIMSPMEGHVFKSVSQNTLDIRGNASGFSLIRYKYALKKGSNVLSFKVSPLLLTPVGSAEDNFSLRAAVLRDAVSEKLDGVVEIDSFVTDSLFFLIPKTKQKKVPVCLDYDLDFAPQHMIFGKIHLKPDSVLIAGQASIVEATDSVFTQEVKGRKLTSSLNGEVDIVPVKGLEVSNAKVVYSIKVARYVENSLQIPVEAINVPKDARMILVPSSVKITFRKEYADGKKLQPEDFTAVADFEKTINSESGKVKVQLEKYPQGVQNLVIDPMFVDRVIMRSDGK